MQAKIDIGIVNYNGGSSLVGCVRSALQMEGVSLRVIVFDNCSQDDSLEMLEKSGLSCQVIRGSENLGYAAACNSLIDSFSAPIGVVANMDLVFAPNWASEVVSHFDSKPSTGAVASLVLHADGKTVNATGIQFYWDLHPQNEGANLPLDQVDLREREVFGCYGAIITFRLDIARLVGPLSNEFFLFYEETEWFWRWMLHGQKTTFVPSAKVFHQRSQVTIRHSLMKLYYPERNRVRSLVRLAPLWWLPIAFCFSVIRIGLQSSKGIPKSDAAGKRQGKLILLRTLFGAWVDGLKCFAQDLGVRSAYYRACAKSPADILKTVRTYRLRLAQLK